MKRSAVTALLLLATVAGAAPMVGQTSQFGIRGLGLPGRAASARTLGLAGSIGLLDPTSSQNAAALTGLGQATSIFTSSTSWGSTSNPDGSANIRETRFPQLLVGGPVPKTPLTLGVSYSMYADRDFSIATQGVASPRGVPVGVTDTLTSRGGLSDIRIAAGWVLSSRLSIGAGWHFITGSNRLAARRVWADSSYDAPQETAELNYSGVGASIGVVYHPVPSLEIGAAFRHDGSLALRRDSGATVFDRIAMPTTLSGGLRFAPRPGLSISGQVTSRNWSRADSGIVAVGAIGARNTLEIGAGVELIRDLKHPSIFPLRAGFRHATLPFLLVPGNQPTESGFALGTGRRFAGDRGGFDLALERMTRSQAGGYHETAWILTFGITVRAGGFTP